MIKKKIKNLVGKLNSKQIVCIIIALIVGIWMILSMTFGIKIPLPGEGYLSCGSQPIDMKVNIEKTTP